MNRYHRILLFCVPFLLFMLCAAPIWGESTQDHRTLTVIGGTEAAGKDTATLKEEAVNDALATAVGVAAAELLAPDEAADRFEALNNVIFGHEKDFIETYGTLSEGVTHQKRFRIPVTVTVSLAPIRQRLRDLESEAAPADSPQPERDASRLLILVAEQHTERGSVHYWWREEAQTVSIISEKAMRKVLSERGYTMVPHETLFQDPEIMARIRFNPYIEAGEAAVVGRSLGAGAVIVGTAVARKSLEVIGEEMQSFSATVSVRAFSTEGGKEIAEVVQTSVESGLDEITARRAALEKAGEMCGKKLAEKLRSAKAGPVAEEGIRVIVGGTGNLGNFVMFRRELREIKGIEAIRLEEMRTNEAVLQVDYDGDGATLAKAIREKDFNAFTIKLYEAAPGEVRLELVSP